MEWIEVWIVQTWEKKKSRKYRRENKNQKLEMYSGLHEQWGMSARNIFSYCL